LNKNKLKLCTIQANRITEAQYIPVWELNHPAAANAFRQPHKSISIPTFIPEFPEVYYSCAQPSSKKLEVNYLTPALKSLLSLARIGLLVPVHPRHGGGQWQPKVDDADKGYTDRAKEREQLC